MMIRDPRDKVPQTKPEGGLSNGKAAGAAASSRPWAGLRDPRIVRVARSLGGKDRHSKVSTIRGLRDRRVRLSVPTAIQLYDLQDRLGLNQPSKVVDWLLDAAQLEIDKLPPLEIPPGSFFHCSQGIAASHGVAPPEEPPSGPAMAVSMEYTAKHRDSTRGAMEETDGSSRRVEQEQRAGEAHNTVIPQSRVPMLGLAGSGSDYNSAYHMEASNLCVPHLGCYQISQGEEFHGYRPATTLSSMFSPYAAAAAAAAAVGYDPKHVNGPQMRSSASQGFMLNYVPSSLLHSSASANMRPFEVSISSRHNHVSQRNPQSDTE